MVAELDPCQQQIGAHGDPDLRQYGIPGGAKERFDFQILFDVLEEQFNLPPGFVNVGDGLGRQMEVVGQEHVVLAGFRITIADAA